jgi:tRNA pseudouridine55 synthase
MDTVKDGIIVIDKPQGMTSHDVVGLVRRLTGVRRVGHTGTLDPMATGVLPVCVGRATRIIEFIDRDDSQDAKAYDCEMRLGVRTDTDDIWGSVSSMALRAMPDADSISAVFAGMTGDIDQVPPAYSAIKHKGRKLYDLARRGEDIPAEALRPRRVHIENIEVTDIEGDIVKFSVACSKGTYVRSICRDAGEALGCGAAMSALRRTKSGVFTLADATAPPAHSDGVRLLPMDAAIPFLPAARIDVADVRRFATGLAVNGAVTGDFVRVYSGGRFIGIGKAACDKIKPYKVIVQD